MFYYIILFIFLICIAYIMGITIVTLIDRHLSRISINLPKQNVIVNFPVKKEKNVENIKNNIDEIESFDNYDIKYNNIEIIEKNNSENKDLCLENHMHGESCNKGEMNYADPYKLSSIDKRYFKYNYPKNLTIQDYINWLWQYSSTLNELSYEHLRNFNKLKLGEKIDNIPQTKLEYKNDSIEYYNKIYDNISYPYNDTLDDYDSYNIVNYPQVYK